MIDILELSAISHTEERKKGRGRNGLSIHVDMGNILNAFIHILLVRIVMTKVIRKEAGK